MNRWIGSLLLELGSSGQQNGSIFEEETDNTSSDGIWRKELEQLEDDDYFRREIDREISSMFPHRRRRTRGASSSPIVKISTPSQRRGSLSEEHLVGKRPIGASLVGQALKDRILVISSQTSQEFINLQSPCDWSKESTNELVLLYQAGPVLFLDEVDVDIEDFHPDDLTESDSEDDVWTKDAKVMHSTIARIVTDWLAMLSAFDYI